MTEVRSRGLVGLVLSFGMLACGPEGGSDQRAPTESTHERLTPITATWTAEGPGPIIQGQVENLASNPAGFPTMNPNGNQVTGAIHAIVAHPTDPNRIVIGAVNGGIWTTDNALTNPPTWTPRTDLAASPSIGALAIDPTNPNVLLAGFGATSSFDRVGGTLAGLIRSDDFGQTWTKVAPVSTITPEGRNIWSLAIRGDLMLAADVTFFSGVIRSTDGGQNWTGVNGLGFGTVFDMVSDPTNGDRYYAAVGGQGIYRSDNGGLDWVLASGPTSCPSPLPVGCDLLFQSITASFNTTHIELAVGSGGRVYVVVNNNPFAGENNSQPTFIGYTDDQGNTWTTMDIPRLPASPTITVTNASNTNPIVVTLSSFLPVPFSENTSTRRVRISGVTGNTAANGDFRFNFDTTGTMLTLTRCHTSPGCTVAGNGDYLGGGTVVAFDTPHPREGHNVSGGQGSIHLSIGVDPTNQGIVYLGGDRQDSSTLSFHGGRNVIGADDFTGNLWRGDTSVPPTGTPPGTAPGPSGVIPSPQWAHLTHDVGAPGIPTGGTASGSAPHADSREIAFDANGNLLQSDDGGIYRRTSPLTNAGDWFSMNGNLQVTELSNIAFDPVTNTVIGGAQDVGNPQQVSPGSATWLEAVRGDGADVQVDIRTRPGFSVRFMSREAFQGPQRCAFNPAGQPVDSLGSPTFPGLNCDFLNLFLRCGGPTPCDDGMGGTFPNDVNPTGFPFQTALGLNEFDAANTARVIIIANNSAYESLDGGDTIFQLRNAGGIPVGGSNRFGTVPLVAGHPLDSELVYLGTPSGFFSRTSATGTLDPTPFQPIGSVLNGIAVDPANPAIVYVATSTNVSWSADGGTTAWTDITGDFFDPGQPVEPSVLRSIAFVPGTPARIFVGTSAGVFMTTTASLGTWGQVGTGSMPNALVVDFDYDQTSDRLFAGTFGRGAFSLPNASSVGGGNLPPVASCVPLVERPAEAMCLAAITVFDVDAGSSDPDGPAPDCTLSPTGPFGPGTFTVTLTCVDSFGASDSCESTVVVADLTPPAFTSIPADISTTTCGSPSLGTATATDNCDPTVTITNNAPAQFTPGTTLVTWTATDDAGNVSTATQRVTLILTDNQACCPAGTNIILGNSNDNTLNGTNGPDCILGRGAQDIINGNGGNDFISGGDGNDTINGGGGNDVIFGGPGQDPIIGGTGNDTIFGGDGNDNIQGGANDDVLNGGQGQDTLLGQDGNDRLNGDDGDDNLQGGNDNDSLVGGTNNDTCNGGTGINTFAQCEFGAPNSCANGVQDGTETGLNCGGACPKCTNGTSCITGNDCQSGLCFNGQCEPETGGGGGALSTNLTISTDWGGGYCATLNVTNSGAIATTSFSVNLDTNASTIYTSWNGNFVGSSGPVSVTPCCSWNTVVDPAETDTSIGFCANRTVSGSGTLPFVVSTTGVF